jgi:sec-independent protein translocase protein TatA
MFPGFHFYDLIIVLVIALLIFGPKKLPEIGSGLGKSIKEFQKGMRELTAPKDEHDEEAKLPASTKDKSKLASTPVDSDASSSMAASETSSQETKTE